MTGLEAWAQKRRGMRPAPRAAWPASTARRMAWAIASGSDARVTAVASSTAALLDARLVPVRIHAPDYALDAAALRAAVTDRTRMIVLNTPHNPTGAVLSPAELESVAEVAREHDLVVLSDEVYEHLVFDDERHVPIATLPGMFERTITVGSTISVPATGNDIVGAWKP